MRSILLCLMAGTLAAQPVQVAQGQLAGTKSEDGKIRIYRGIPYAAPPVGDLRWKPPQPAPNWTGVKSAAAFGSRCMQGRPYPDMVFRDPGISEDCLNLNVWTPAASTATKLPVMVWIYGGGFAAGATSEPRQDGEALARKGVVVVSMNYRLGVFGFFSHPELTKESDRKASGNYGLMDQTAALEWVRDNIAAFGGDPQKVTIFGESAGSFSVNAQMASPRARGLFARAIGESGAFWGNTLRARTLTESESAGTKFADSINAHSLADLRAKPAQEVLDAQLKISGSGGFTPTVDGYFLPEPVPAIFAAGKQAMVPLLAGWNADENSARMILRNLPPTADNFGVRLRELYGVDAEKALRLYHGETDNEIKRAAGDLAGDQFIAFGTWKWIESQVAAKQPVWRYRFDQPSPKDPAIGAVHASEIEFVFQTLTSKDQPWRRQDFRLSGIMSDYWTNFAKTGNPSGKGVPEWPAYSTGKKVMHFGGELLLTTDDHRDRYEFLDSVSAAQAQNRAQAQPARTGFRTGVLHEGYNPALPTLFLIGDSTVKNSWDTGGDGLWGWGRPLTAYFDSTRINVENQALGGTSTRSYITGGHWERVLALVKAGDYVMMQFGHNDGGPGGSLAGNGDDTGERADRDGTKSQVHSYGWYLRKYIAEIKAKGATPVVCSLIPRNDWSEGKVRRARASYATWAKEAAEQGNALFIDLNSIIADRYDKLGEEAVKPFFPKEHTHTGWDGALLNAQCVVEGIKGLKDCPLSRYLAASPHPLKPE